MTGDVGANTTMTKYFTGSMTVKVLASIVSAISAIVAAWVFIDDRYAHASDVDAAQGEIVKELKRNSLQLRLEMTQDRIYDLRMTQEKSGLEPEQKVRLKSLTERADRLDDDLDRLD